MIGGGNKKFHTSLGLPVGIALLNKQLDNASIETIDLKNIINELIINYKSCKESTLICQTDLKKINQRLIDERDEFLNMIINLQDKLNKKN